MGDNVKTFETGAVRSRDAEGTRYDLISPVAMEALARVCAEGATKYGDHNWLKGMPVHDLLNHAIRHVYLFLSGDRSEPHLPHAMWGLMAAIHSHECWPHLNAGHLLGPGCRHPDHREPETEEEMLDAAERASRVSSLDSQLPEGWGRLHAAMYARRREAGVSSLDSTPKEDGPHGDRDPG